MIAAALLATPWRPQRKQTPALAPSESEWCLTSKHPPSLDYAVGGGHPSSATKSKGVRRACRAQPPQR